MSESRLDFLKEAFIGLELQFSEDFAVIMNPNWNGNITVYDDKYEFTVCFSSYHCHCDDEEETIREIREIIDSEQVTIEFFCKGRCCLVSEMAVEALQDLSYEKLAKITGYWGPTKTVVDVADSFSVRGWDSKNNFDFTFLREVNGAVTICKTFVGL